MNKGRFNHGPGLLPASGRILRFTVLMLFLAGLSGCGGGLPDAVKEEAKTLSQYLKKTQTHIRDQESRFSSMASSGTFKPLAVYAKKENWAQAFTQARAILARADGIYDTELSPLIKEDNPDTASRVRQQIDRIKRIAREAADTARIPFDRMERIRTVMAEMPAIHTRTLADAREIASRVRGLEAGPVTGALEKFPDSAALITARVAPLSKLGRDAGAGLAVVEKEYKAHAASGNADYAAFATGADAVAKARTAIDTEAPRLEKDLALLYQSYTKVLQDMKVDYYVTIKRESWDDRSDYYDPRFATFTRQVTPATYQALADTNVESIGDVIPSFGRVSFRNNIGNTWQALDINPVSNWPVRAHNAATFWVDNTRETYYHKYLQESGGETEETGWIKVNPSFYAQNIDNLGMAIMSKPYGVFEPDPQAAPPGMAYVGNPAYGEWKTDENGENFWSWYGRYAFFSNLFFFPPYYYHYGSWNRWRTDYRYKKPYYGKTRTGGYTFGTRGTQVKQSPRYQNTTFAKTGGFKSGPASVRGGGAALRGGGPKGKGK
ncbi:MAG: hypothetical protein V6Z89_14935 [Desulfobacter sp.]